MKVSRRMKRMSGSNKHKAGGLSLVSLMDVFTILVFFLLTNSSSDEVLTNPKEIALPESSIETKPRTTIVIFVGADTILVQGEVIMLTEDALKQKAQILRPVKDKLLAQKENVIGLSTKAIAESTEVTVLADKKVPFYLLKKIMTTSTSAGYVKISLAVIQKAAKS